MSASVCPFCEPDTVIVENDLARAIPDRSPVRPGHTLIVPKRHVETIFEATEEEVLAFRDLLLRMKEILDEDHSPGGYRIGINAGRAAGQSVMHLHIHLVPMGEGGTRRRGEVFSRGDM